MPRAGLVSPGGDHSAGSAGHAGQSLGLTAGQGSRGLERPQDGDPGVWRDRRTGIPGFGAALEWGSRVWRGPRTGIPGFGGAPGRGSPGFGGAAGWAIPRVWWWIRGQVLATQECGGPAGGRGNGSAQMWLLQLEPGPAASLLLLSAGYRASASSPHPDTAPTQVF